MLQKQNLNIAVNSELDTKSDPFLTDAQSALVQENVRFYKTGALVKRNGFNDTTASLAQYDLDGFTTKRLNSDGKSLFLTGSAGKEEAMLYSQSRQRWEKLFNQGSVNLSDNATSAYVGADIELLRMIAPNGDVLSYWVDYYEGETLILVRSSFSCTMYVVADTGEIRALSGGVLSQITNDGICGILVIGGQKYYCAAVTNPVLDQLAFIFFDKLTLTEDLFAISGYLQNSPVAGYVTADRSKLVVTAKASATTFRVGVFNTSTELSGGTNTFDGALLISGVRPSICANGTGYCVSYSQSGSSAGRSKLFALNNVFAITSSVVDTNVVDINGGRVAVCSTGSEIHWYYDLNGTANRVRCSRKTLALASISTQDMYDSSISSGAYSLADKSFCVVATHPETSSYPYKTGLVISLFPAFDTFTRVEPVASFFYDRSSLAGNPGNMVADANGVARFLCLNALRADVLNGKTFNGTSIIDAQANTVIDGLGLLSMDPLNRKKQYGSAVSIGGVQVDAHGLTCFFDGTQLTQLGFNYRPFIVSATPLTVGGTITAGTYKYKFTYELFDSFGRLLTSQESNEVSATTTGSTSSVSVSVRISQALCAYIYKLVLYRTKNAGGIFYKVAESQVVNGFSGMSPTESIVDTTPDSGIATSARIIYTTGGVLENDPPPPAKHATTHNDRVIVVPADEFNKVYYSKKIIQGELPSFSQFLFIQLFSGNPKVDDAITATASLGDKLIIFREQSTYWIAGDGADELGLNSTLTSPEKLSIDIGCTELRSVTELPVGVMFKSAKGIYLIDGGLSVNYVGAAVEEYNSQEIVSSVLVKDRNIVQFATAANILTFDYLAGRWSIDAISGVNDIAVLSTKTVVLKDGSSIGIESGAYLDNFGETTTSISQKLVTGWIKLSGIQDFGRIYRLLILGRYYSAHTLTCKVYYDYSTDYSETYTITPNPAQGIYQFKIHLKKQKCESIKVEIYDTGTGQSMDLSGLTMEVGVKRGTFKTPAVKQY